MYISTKCNSCDRYCEAEGDKLNFESFCGFLKGQGWYISNNLVFCPKCRVRAEKNLLKEIFGDN